MQNSPAAAAALSEGRNHPNRGKGIAAYWTGRPRPDMRGENNPNWNGGEVRQTRHTEMGRVEYKVWRQTVFKRDGYACVLCDATGVKFEANHIRLWRDHPECRYDVDNGVTLCVPCHKGIRGIEQDFEARFLAYVTARQPVELTPDGRDRLLPFVTPCDQCGRELVKPRGHRARRWHFCDKVCKREFEKSINADWKGAALRRPDVA